MNHDAICTGLDECSGSLKRIFHTTLKNQTLNSCDNHEVIRKLRVFASSNLSAEVFYGILRLFYLGTKQGVLLESCLVLDDDCRNTHLLKSSVSINEVLSKPSCIAIENDGFRSNFSDIINGAETGSHVNKFDIWLTLCS